MDFIKNGNFETGTTEWMNLTYEPLDWKVVSHNNKKWLHTYGLGAPLDGAFRQVIHKTGDLWDIHYRITFTVKAIPTGGTAQDTARPDAGVKRLKAEMLYYFTYYPGLDNIFYPGGSADVSVVEKTFTQRIVMTHFGPILNGDLVMINWAGDGYDKADILITDIKLEKVDPEIDPADPEASAEDVRIIDLTSVGLCKYKISPMKEVK